jgi:hypothetical protein
VKVTLLFRCRADYAFVPVYVAVARIITRQIVLGMVLLTLSGIGWLVLGYGLTPLLVVKLVLVGAIWTLGPLIDNVVEPKFGRLAPAAGEPASAEFIRTQAHYLMLEVIATALFFVIILIWVLG